VSTVASRSLKLIDRSIMQSVQLAFKCCSGYLAQTALWRLINAHPIREYQTSEDLVKSVLYVF